MNFCCVLGFGFGDWVCDGMVGLNVVFGGSGFWEIILEVDGMVLVVGFLRVDWE